MKPELLKQLKSLKSKTVRVEYGIRLTYTGVLLSWTNGSDSKVWLSDHRSDISIPSNQIRSVKEI